MRPVVEVTKELEFEACHHLLNYNGPCARPHGHSYKLQVTVEGELNEQGMVLDFSCLKKMLKTEIVDKLDHRDLNEELPHLSNTTAELMVVDMWETIELYLSKLKQEDKSTSTIKLVEIKLWETRTNYATYRGKHRV